MFGVMRIINLAHGDRSRSSARTWRSSSPSTWHVSPYLALVPVLPGALVVGYVLQRTMLERSLRAGQLVPLLTTFGLLDRDREPAAEVLLARRALARRTGSIGDGELAGRRAARRSRAFDVLTLGVAVVVLGGLQLVPPRHAARARAARDGRGRRHRRARRDQRARRVRARDRDRGRDGGARRRLPRDALVVRPERRGRPS